MTQNDLKVEWHAGFSVDAAEIDTYQKKMFDLFNELIELKQKKRKPRQLPALSRKSMITVNCIFQKKKKYSNSGNIRIGMSMPKPTVGSSKVPSAFAGRSVRMSTI